MTTRQVDVKHIEKLPSVKSWRSTELTKRLVFKLFSGLRHGELVAVSYTHLTLPTNGLV